MMTLLPKAHLALGFKVFITLPGVVTSRVPFHVDPGFYGEHNFFLHGIHTIIVSCSYGHKNTFSYLYITCKFHSYIICVYATLTDDKLGKQFN